MPGLALRRSFLCLLAALPVGLGAQELRDTEVEFFEKKIRPLLVRRCYKCHAASAKKLKGGLLLDSREGWMDGGDSGTAIEPGDPDDSLLIRAVRYDDDDLQMPPRGKLDDEEIRSLIRWVEMGAPDPRSGGAVESVATAIDPDAARQFWAFQAPRAPPVPEVRDASWPRTAVDRFVLATLEAKDLRPIGDADRRTLIRRVSFDLTGLPPTPQESEAFVRDPSPDAYANLVDRLLASERFGERWGRHWLDIARYAESTGKTRNYPYSFAWRYRDYVIDSFNRDKPYDRFITEQVAGDLLPAASKGERDEQHIATAFLALGPKDLNERNARQYLMDNVDEQIDTTSRALLALTVSCARCHDHKFDPIPTTDYYALAGIFGSTEILAGMTSRQGGGKRYRGDLLIPLAAVDDGGAPGRARPPEAGGDLAPLEKRLARARRQLAQLQQQSATRAQLRQARQEVKKLAGRIKKLAKKAAPEPPASSALAMGVRDRAKPTDCRVHIRGDVSNLGPRVSRGVLGVLGGGASTDIAADASGRLELAAWLTRRDNPLTARVMVNRIWHHLFGAGLVRTVDNFGHSGERPSHPELLDHLAVEFMNGGWSVKRAIRTLVLSRVYGLASGHDDGNHAVDPDTRFLWRMSQRRLDVESLRDAMLAASGRLDLARPSGSVVMAFRMGELGRGRGTGPADEPVEHRSVYLPILRGIVPDILETFDFADPSMVKGRRDVTTVATQALYLMNSPFVLSRSQQFARRLLERDGLDDGGRLDLAYRLALGRAPAAAERARALDYLRGRRRAGGADGGETATGGERLAAWSGFCQALFACAEFRYVD